jgi:hypothetical protein
LSPDDRLLSLPEAVKQVHGSFVSLLHRGILCISYNSIYEVKTPTELTFEEALLNGGACGYAVCLKPLRFAKLPDHIAMSFAEIQQPNRYYVFEVRAEAIRHLEQIPTADQLGATFSVQEVRAIHTPDSRHGPKYDPCGHPFQMRGFIVDRHGTPKEWTHAAKLGWRTEMLNMDSSVKPSTRWQRMKAWLQTELG